ncbi:hypothetical protein BC567DRAFT_229378 [Phyllosticta citribraziliensis]
MSRTRNPTMHLYSICMTSFSVHNSCSGKYRSTRSAAQTLSSTRLIAQFTAFTNIIDDRKSCRSHHVRHSDHYVKQPQQRPMTARSPLAQLWPVSVFRCPLDPISPYRKHQRRIRGQPGTSRRRSPPASSIQPTNPRPARHRTNPLVNRTSRHD